MMHHDACFPLNKLPHLGQRMRLFLPAAMITAGHITFLSMTGEDLPVSIGGMSEARQAKVGQLGQVHPASAARLVRPDDTSPRMSWTSAPLNAATQSNVSIRPDQLCGRVHPDPAASSSALTTAWLLTSYQCWQGGPLHSQNAQKFVATGCDCSAWQQ